MLVGSVSLMPNALGHGVARGRRDHHRVVDLVVQHAHRHGARRLVAHESKPGAKRGFSSSSGIL
jgi:hypothetical protein